MWFLHHVKQKWARYMTYFLIFCYLFLYFKSIGTYYQRCCTSTMSWSTNYEINRVLSLVFIVYLIQCPKIMIFRTFKKCLLLLKRKKFDLLISHFFNYLLEFYPSLLGRLLEAGKHSKLNRQFNPIYKNGLKYLYMETMINKIPD